MTNTPQEPHDWHTHWQAEAEAHAKARAGLMHRLVHGKITTLALGTALLMAMMWGATNWRRLAGGGPAPEMASPPPNTHDTIRAHFERCHGPGATRINCIIDGDTVWVAHQKIRVADENAPEISEPQCDYELDLGEKATDRLQALLNAGPFSLVASESRDVDVYGRKLRTITRGGQSLGMILVKEGLAEKWVGFRRNWCD